MGCRYEGVPPIVALGFVLAQWDEAANRDDKRALSPRGQGPLPKRHSGYLRSIELDSHGVELSKCESGIRDEYF